MIEFITQIDHSILLFIQENLRFDWFTEPTIFVSHLGDHGKIWIILCLTLLLFKRTRKAGICGLLALLINLLITNVTLKPLVARVRPYEQFNDLILLLERQKDFSFPSGHTSSSFAAAWAIFQTYRLPKLAADCSTRADKNRKMDTDGWKKEWSLLGISALILAVWIGWSRIYVAVHFPTDVLAGAVIGVFSAWTAGRMIEVCIRWRKEKEIIRHYDEKEEDTCE